MHVSVLMTNKELSITHTRAHVTWGAGVWGRGWYEKAGAGSRQSWSLEGGRTAASSCWSVPGCRPQQTSSQQNSRKCLPQTQMRGTCSPPGAHIKQKSYLHHALKKVTTVQLTSCDKTVLNWWRRTVSWSKGRKRGHCGNPLKDDTTNHKSDIKCTGFWGIQPVVFSHLQAYTQCWR